MGILSRLNYNDRPDFVDVVEDILKENADSLGYPALIRIGVSKEEAFYEFMEKELQERARKFRPVWDYLDTVVENDYMEILFKEFETLLRQEVGGEDEDRISVEYFANALDTHLSLIFNGNLNTIRIDFNDENDYETFKNKVIIARVCESHFASLKEKRDILSAESIVNLLAEQEDEEFIKVFLDNLDTSIEKNKELFEAENAYAHLIAAQIRSCDEPIKLALNKLAVCLANSLFYPNQCVDDYGILNEDVLKELDNTWAGQLINKVLDIPQYGLEKLSKIENGECLGNIRQSLKNTQTTTRKLK